MLNHRRFGIFIKTKSLWDQLTEYLSCWLPDLDTDYDVIAGMILATAIQGTLPFRPHLWITGATNTGKTALFTLLGRLWPHALRLENETTEAAIRQSIQRSCLPVLLDECEGWHGRRRVIVCVVVGTVDFDVPVMVDLGGHCLK